MTSSITLAQITDTHLVPMDCSRLRDFPTQQSLAQVLAAAQTHHPDYLLLTGDLADAGDEEAYRQLTDLITPLNIPTLWLPGNHDSLTRMAIALAHPPFDARKSLTLGGWRVILLNSVLTTSCIGMGVLPIDTLGWLRQELHQNPDTPTLIALHHHPLPTHIDWLDQISLQDAEAFYATIDPFPQVRLVLFGHIHQAFHQQRHAVDYYGCPSTCTQVAPAPSPGSESSDKPEDEPSCEAETMQPGFRWLRLHADGRHETGIDRVAFIPPTAPVR